MKLVVEIVGAPCRLVNTDLEGVAVSVPATQVGMASTLSAVG